jgi:hypothetical protein
MTSNVSDVRKLAELLPSIEWLWRPWLPRGFVTLLVGEPGVGKSAVALALANSVVAPAAWPDGAVSPAQPGTVFWADTEASQALLVERVREWGLPPDRILLPPNPLDTVSLSSPQARQDLTNLVVPRRPNLLVIDSLGGAHSGDENKAQDMKPILQYLSDLARDSQIAVLVVHHVRKKGTLEKQAISLDRIRGSSVIVQFARIAMALEKVENGLTLSVIKSNLAEPPPKLSVTVDDGGVEFKALQPVTAEELSRNQRIDSWLERLLWRGPMAYKTIEERAKTVGFSRRALYAAKRRMGLPTTDGKWDRTDAMKDDDI